MLSIGRLRAARPFTAALSSDFAFALPAVAIATVFAFACGTLAWQLNVWQDEAYSLHTTGGSLANALQQGLYFEAQAPLYFVLLWFWRLPEHAPFEARILSILMVLGALFVARWFAQRYLRGVNADLVMAAIALNPFTVWAAVEARSYGAIILLSALLIALFFRGFLDERPSTSARVAFVVLAAAGIYTQYYIAGLVAAGGCTLALMRRWRALLWYIVGGLAVCVAISPLAAIIPLQMRAYSAFSEAMPLPAYAIAIAPLGFLFPHDWIASWAHDPIRNALYAVVLAVPLALAVRGIRRVSTEAIALVSLTAFVCAFFALVIGVADQRLLMPRHTAVLLVPTLLAAFAFVACAPARRRALVLASFACVYAAFSLASLWHDYAPMAKPGDWSRVAAFIGARGSAQDPVAVFDAEAELPLRMYTGGRNPIVPIPRPLAFDRFDETTFALHDEREVADSLGRAAVGHDRVWLVRNDACDRAAAFYGCALLDGYVRRHFVVALEQRFAGSDVIELLPIAHRT